MPLTWSHTFDPDPDFAAHDDDQPVGRSRDHQFGTVSGQWWWGVNCIQMDPRALGFALFGERANKDKAAKMVRTTLERVQASSDKTERPLALSMG